MNDFEQLEKELQQIRVLIAGIAIHQNGRLETLEAWAEKQGLANKSPTGFLAKLNSSANTVPHFRMPFAPIQKCLRRIQHYFEMKMNTRKGYEQIGVEYGKEGKDGESNMQKQILFQI